METQFDECPRDRPLILHRMHTLNCLLRDAHLLNWDFFIARFDCLAIETQLNMAAQCGEISVTQGEDYFGLTQDFLLLLLVFLSIFYRIFAVTSDIQIFSFHFSFLKFLLHIAWVFWYFLLVSDFRRLFKRKSLQLKIALKNWVQGVELLTLINLLKLKANLLIQLIILPRVLVTANATKKFWTN